MDYSKVVNGWSSQEELSYWISESDVEGTIPLDLYGSFIRNGPGVNDVYGKKLKHPIDGDGMVCKVSFIDGKVHFCSKFVKTKQHMDELKEQKFIYAGQMGTRNHSRFRDTLATTFGMITGNFPNLVFRNPSNTNAFYWGGKILTLYETQIPYCLDPFTLETLGPEDLNGTLSLNNAAAHFRIDPVTMNLIMFSLRPGVKGSQPWLEINEFDRRWNLVNNNKLSIDGLNYAHDFLLFPNFYVFHMTPFVNVSSWEAFKIMAGFSSPGETMRYNSHLPSKFVVIPRNAKSSEEVMEIPTDPCHIFHFGTAEEVVDELRFNCVCLDEKMTMEFAQGVWLSNTDVSPGHLFHVTLNLKQKTCQRKLIDGASSEFPTTHPYRHGVQGTRYVYLMASNRNKLPYQDVIKVNTVTLKRNIWHSDGVIGEPVYVPRHGYDSNKDGSAEDDGYVLVQLYHPTKHRTDFCVLDAQNIEGGPVARIKLKHHVPYGFHGTFSPEVFLYSPISLKSKL